MVDVSTLHKKVDIAISIVCVQQTKVFIMISFYT